MSTSSSASRSETNARRAPSGETRGQVSLSPVAVRGTGVCQLSESRTG